MGDLGMQLFIARIHYQLRQLGWQGWLGSLLVLLAGSAIVLFAYPQWQHAQVLQHDIAQLQLEMPKRQEQWVDRSPQASLNTFYGFLPAENSANQVLSVILSQATEHGITPQKAEYKLMRDPDAQFSRYQVILPVQGEYVAIRKFVIGVLNALPAAALNDISFKRVEDGGQAVEASIRSTVFLRRGAM